jgi:hypothetical protein
LWTTSLAKGLAVVVLSPGRGLLFYSPIFIFSLAGLALAWRKNGDLLLRYLGVGAILSIMLAAKWHKTSGGESFGPRLLADITPIMALALFPLADSIRNRRALAAAFAMLCAWSITANASGAFISYRGWNQWALGDADQRLWLWGDNPVVDPFRSAIDSMRIALGRRPTSRNSPGLLDASLVVLNAPPHDTAPGARVHVALRATNIGKAVWLGGHSADERGVVSLGWEWKRDGKAIGDSEVRRELHRDVFPGDSMDLDASAPVPDEPGLYVLEISLAAGFSPATRSIGPLVTVPITVTPNAAAPDDIR